MTAGKPGTKTAPKAAGPRASLAEAHRRPTDQARLSQGALPAKATGRRKHTAACKAASQQAKYGAGGGHKPKTVTAASKACR